MPRLLLTLSTLATTCGIAAAVAPTSEQKVAVVGRERPLFLGSATVTASALPPR